MENERRNSRLLKTEKTIFFQKRNELEEFFLKCVDEVRKDIERRKAVTLARKSNLNSTLPKKKAEEGLETAIKNENFTGTDKRKVIDLLMSNENVLLFLYEKLFPRGMTTESLLNKPHLTGATANSFNNLGFRPQTAMQRSISQFSRLN